MNYGTIRNIPVITAMLEKGLNVLRDVGVNFWLSDGALLGIARTGEVFEKDHDWDIGIFANNRQQSEIIRRLGEIFHPLQWSDERLFGRQQGYAFYDSDWIFDCRFWYKYGFAALNAQRFPSPSGWEIGTFIEPSRFFENPAEIEYHGVKIPIPNPLNEYLGIRYGKDWETMLLTGSDLWWEYSASLRKEKLIQQIWSRL